MDFTVKTWCDTIEAFDVYCDALIRAEKKWQAGPAREYITDAYLLDIDLLDDMRASLVWIAGRLLEIEPLLSRASRKKATWTAEEEDTVEALLDEIDDRLDEMQTDAAQVYGGDWDGTYVGMVLYMGRDVLRDLL